MSDFIDLCSPLFELCLECCESLQVHSFVFCLCGLCNHSHLPDLEHCAACCCRCCCRVLESGNNICLNTDVVYVDCGGCGVSPSVICAWVVAGVCTALSCLCFATAYRFGYTHCDRPIDAHTIVQGAFMLVNAVLLVYITVRYYVPRSLALPNPESLVFQRFYGLFSRDFPLGALVGGAVMGFWWSLLGFYWLSQVDCDPEDDFLLSIDSLAVGAEFVLLLSALILVYCLIVLAACDEGSCRFESMWKDCCLCCCGCCWKEGRRRARKPYSAERQSCVDGAMRAAMRCGCVRPGYIRDRREASKNKVEPGHDRSEESKGEVSAIGLSLVQVDLDGDEARNREGAPANEGGEKIQLKQGKLEEEELAS